MRVLVTGAAGFVGGHLENFVTRRKNTEFLGISLLNPANNPRIHVCDICDARKLESIVRRFRPDRIFHLAAQSSVPLSWKEPKKTFEQNVMGALNLLEAVRRTGLLKTRIHIAGSAQEYGIPAKRTTRLNESAKVNPLNPYAASKASQDLLASIYAGHFGIRIVRTRAFNHIGPGQNEQFVASSLARQIALIEAGKQMPEIKVGNIDTVRDYTDVRDVVRAYWLALEKAAGGEVYNIASGRGRTAREILEYYIRISGVKIKLHRDPARFRPDDVPRLVGDPRNFMRATGWEPEIPFQKTLRDILDYWREKIRGK